MSSRLVSLVPTLCATLAVMGAVSLGCGPSVARSVRSDAPTATDAYGGGTCVGPDQDAEPWVVDLQPDKRLALESALRGGVVVVSYDCKDLKILRGCSVDGRYDYSGTTLVEDRIVMEDADAIAANLSGGAALAAQMKAEMERGTKLYLGFKLVGQRSTTVPTIYRSQLEGNCKTATHFVSTASIGAYALASSSAADLGTTADIFGRGASGKSESSAVRNGRVGDPTACNRAGLDDSEPPPQCGAPVKVTLVALVDGQPAPGERMGSISRRPGPPPCPPGTVRSGYGCVSTKKDPPHACQVGDMAECDKQCGRGDAQSCANLGYMFERGKGVRADDRKARDAYKASCEKKNLDGCTGLAFLINKEDPKTAAKYFQEACGQGNGRACSGIGFQMSLVRNYQESARWDERGCKLGFQPACYYAGKMVMHMREPDEKRAFDNYLRACYGGEERGCLAVSGLLSGGLGTPADQKKAAGMRDQALAHLVKECDNKDAESCEVLGDYMLGRYRTPPQPDKAVDYYNRACAGGQWDTCYDLGMLVEAGAGGIKPNKDMAKRLFDTACSHDVEPACKKTGKKK